MALHYVLSCTDCGHDTFLPPFFLKGIFLGRVSSLTRKELLNLVCPHCGNGRPYYLYELSAQEFSRDPYAPQGDPAPIHVSLSCVREGCESHARVHTIRAGGSANEIDEILPTWKLDHITCFAGHPVRVPIERKPSLLDKKDA